MQPALRTGTLAPYATCTGTPACEPPLGSPKPAGATSTPLNTDVSAPLASPTERTATATNAGDLLRLRSAYFRSSKSASTGRLESMSRATLDPRRRKRPRLSLIVRFWDLRWRERTRLRFFHVPAELEPHGGQHAVLEFRLSARAEALIERGGEN